MRGKLIKKCIEKLEKARMGRMMEQNINYVIEAFKIELSVNKFRARSIIYSKTSKLEK